MDLKNEVDSTAVFTEEDIIEIDVANVFNDVLQLGAYIEQQTTKVSKRNCHVDQAVIAEHAALYEAFHKDMTEVVVQLVDLHNKYAGLMNQLSRKHSKMYVEECGREACPLVMNAQDFLAKHG